MAGIKNVSAIVNPNAMLDGRTGKPKRLTKKLRGCIELLLSGQCKTIKAAGERAKLRSDYLSRAFRQPHVAAYIEERTRAVLSEGRLLAAPRLLQLIHAKSEHVAFDASVHTLAVSGITPPERNGANVNVSIGIAAGYVIDLSGPEDEAPRPVCQQPQHVGGKYSVDPHGRLISDDDEPPVKPWEVTPVGRQVP